MKPQYLITVALIIALFLTATATAFETDQYNLPPEPLVDIGDEVSEYIEANLLAAIDQVNADIAAREACITKASTQKCGTEAQERAQLARLWADDAIATELFRRIGDGSLFVTKFGRWMASHKFRRDPATYKTSYGDSIFLTAPLNYATISPTVRLYGVEMGTDKLEHLLQQGYKYYTIVGKAKKDGEPREAAVRRAVRWGQRTERTYFGTLVSGVFSNADLYANYAGLRFYQGLTEKVQIGGEVRPPVLLFEQGRWTVSKHTSPKDMLAPLMTDHLNEALNPSGFAFHVYHFVRRRVERSSCAGWRERYPDVSRSEMTKRSAALERWNGEDYGFTKKSRMFSIAEACFSDRP